MDTSEIRAAVGHLQNDHGDDRTDKTRTNFTSRTYSVQSKVIEDLDNGSLSKREVHTTRPCAIIGPDRILPQQSKQDVYNPPPTRLDPWMQSHHELAYHKSITYQRPTEHSYPPRNISPRQTFQENMPRILVPPRNDVIKMTHEHVGASGYPYQSPIYAAKILKSNGPQVGKVYDVPPHVVNQIQRERRVCEQKSDIYIPKCDVPPDVVTAVHNKNNIEEHGWQQVPITPYQGVNYPLDHRYSEYQPCLPVYRSMKPYKKIQHENPPPQAFLNEAYYRTERYEPYPAPKEKYMRARYEYQPNSSQIQYPTFPAKYEFNKSVIQGQMPVQYQQMPQHRVVEVSPDCVHKMPVPRHTPNFNVPYNNENINIKQGPHESFPHHSKVYGYSVDIDHRHMPKGAYESGKRFVEYNSRVRNIPYPDNHFPPDQIYTNCHKGQVPYYNFPPTNATRVPNYNVNYHRMFEGPVRPYPDYNVPCKNPDMRQNMFNPLARIPTEFSPNIISPTDSNTSVESIPPHMIQEDCGYVSQCSTTSSKSADFHFSRLHNYEHSLNKMPEPRHPINSLNYKPSLNQSVQEYSHSTSHNTCSVKENAKSKKHIDVRQFLQMWDEEFEDECSPLGKTNNISKETGNLLKVPNQNNSQNSDQLYVLGLVNVSNEELKKYEHIQKVTKLPENIKGYDNIELLNQFDEVFGSSQQSNQPLIDISYRNEHKKQNSTIEPHIQPPRPPSPLDVEAKITQSVIHKEVGCNFEIKPCSPERLNVNIDTLAPTNFHEGQNTSIYDNCSEQVTLSLPESNSSDLRISSNHEQEKKLNPKRKEKRKLKTLDKEISTKQIKICDYNHSEVNHTIDGNLASNCANEQYAYNDAATNAPCYSSLPQLDSDIDAGLCKKGEDQSLKRNNVLEQYQFGSLNQDEIAPLNTQLINHCSDITNNDSEPERVIMNIPSKVEISPSVEDIQNLSNTDDKSGSKLSKYRKIKVKDCGEHNTREKDVIKSCTNITVSSYDASTNNLHDKNLPILIEAPTTKSPEILTEHEDLIKKSKEFETTITTPVNIDNFNTSQQNTHVIAKTDTMSSSLLKATPSIYTNSTENTDRNPCYEPNDILKDKAGIQQTYSSMDVHHGFKNLIMKRIEIDSDSVSNFNNNGNGSNGLSIKINNKTNKNMTELVSSMSDEESELKVNDYKDSKVSIALDLTKSSMICNSHESVRVEKEYVISDNEFSLETINSKLLNKVSYEKEHHSDGSKNKENTSELKEICQEGNHSNNAILNIDKKMENVNVAIKACKKNNGTMPSVTKFAPNECDNSFLESKVDVFKREKKINNADTDNRNYLSNRYDCLYGCLTKRNLHFLLTQLTERVIVNKHPSNEKTIAKVSSTFTDICPKQLSSPPMMVRSEKAPTRELFSTNVVEKSEENGKNPLLITNMNLLKIPNVDETSKVIDNKNAFDGETEVLSNENPKFCQSSVSKSNICMLVPIENSTHVKSGANESVHIDDYVNIYNHFENSKELGGCHREMYAPEEVSIENCVIKEHNQGAVSNINHSVESNNDLATSISVDDKVLSDLPMMTDQRDTRCHLSESMDKNHDIDFYHDPKNIDSVITTHNVNDENKSENEKEMTINKSEEIVQQSYELILANKEKQEFNKVAPSNINDTIMGKGKHSIQNQTLSNINIQTNKIILNVSEDIIQETSSKNKAEKYDESIQDDAKVTSSILDTEYPPTKENNSTKVIEIIGHGKCKVSENTCRVCKDMLMVCPHKQESLKIKNSKTDECCEMECQRHEKFQEQESFSDIRCHISSSEEKIERCLTEDDYDETLSIKNTSNSLNYNLSLPINYSLICSTSLISPLSDDNSPAMDNSCENGGAEGVEFDSETEKNGTKDTNDIKKHQLQSLQNGALIDHIPLMDSTPNQLRNEAENEQIINTVHVNINDNLEGVDRITSSIISSESMRTDNNCGIVSYVDECNHHSVILLSTDSCENILSPNIEASNSPIQATEILNEDRNIWPCSSAMSENDGEEEVEDLKKNYYLSTNDVIKDLSTHSDNTSGKGSNNDMEYLNYKFEFVEESEFDDKADTNDNYVIYNDSLMSEDTITVNLEQCSESPYNNNPNESTGDNEQYRSESIAVKFDDCWIDDVACIETVVSEDVDSEGLSHDNDTSLENEDLDNNVLNRLSNIITQVNKKGLDNLNTSLPTGNATSMDTNYIDAETLSKQNYSRGDREMSDRIALKNKSCNHISQYSNEIVSQDVGTRRVNMRTSDSTNEHRNGGRKLVTKAAQKYIPPLNINGQNFKVHLPLPKSNLLHLKKLKLERTLKKDIIHATKKDSPVKKDAMEKSVIPKRIKPKFEDVLMNIDHVQMSLAKSKQKKYLSTQQCIPKMIIKKNENGAHYTSTTIGNKSFNPDLTGSKWQPWVCMEKSSFIDRMIRKNKFVAKYCRASNKYILPSQSSHKNKELQKKKTFTFLCNNIEVKNDLNSLKCTIKLNSKTSDKKSRKTSSHANRTYQHSKYSSLISNYRS